MFDFASLQPLAQDLRSSWQELLGSMAPNWRPQNSAAPRSWNDFLPNWTPGRSAWGSQAIPQPMTNRPMQGPAPTNRPMPQATPTTAPVDASGLRGGILSIAERQGLDPRVVNAILETEGGLTGARGDRGQSVGPFQFYSGGQLANYAKSLGIGLSDAFGAVANNPLAAAEWALQNYLGNAIREGMRAGYSGPDLATYAQRFGQVSVDPWRAGENYRRLYGGGQ